VLLKTEDRDKITGETPTLHHYTKSRKRRTKLTIIYLLDENRIMTMGQKEIIHIFTDHMTRRYNRIMIDERCIQEIISCGMNTIPMTANSALEEPLTVGELLTAVRRGKAHNSPGQDGICREFYKMTWEIIKHDMLDVMNHMYKHGWETDAQKSGTIVCLPKKADPGGPDYYRPLT
jgi:hypothetical protein